MGAIKSFLQFTIGTGVGAACGYTAARLFAPQTGDDLHGSVESWSNKVSQAGLDASEEVRSNLEGQYRNLVSSPDAPTAQPPASKTQSSS